MYCAVYESCGLSVAQAAPFVVRNTVAPDPVYLSQLYAQHPAYRARAFISPPSSSCSRVVLYLGLLSLAFVFNANLVSSSYISFVVGVGLSGAVCPV